MFEKRSDEGCRQPLDGIAAAGGGSVLMRVRTDREWYFQIINT